jgi:drug/metabolite transporter, DME family
VGLATLAAVVGCAPTGDQHHTVAYLLYGRGLRTVRVPVAVTIGLAEPAVAALLGLIVLGERLSPTGVAGLILISLALIGLAVDGTAGQLAPGPPG